MQHYDNLIVGIALMILLLLFLRSNLNAVHPNLFEMLLSLMKVATLYMLKISVWILKMALAMLDINWNNQELPGRRK